MHFKSLFLLAPFVAAMPVLATPVAGTDDYSFSFDVRDAKLAKRQGTNARFTWYDISVGLYVSIYCISVHIFFKKEILKDRMRWPLFKLRFRK